MFEGVVFRLIVRRVLLGLVTLFLVSVVVFVATQYLPGDAAQAVLGRSATPERLEALRTQLSLDDPAPVQYWRWLTGLLSGDAGVSLANQKPIIPQVMPRVANSFTLLAITVIVAVPVAIAAGILAAVRKDSGADATMTVAALGLAAAPEFVIAIGLIAMFSTVVFHWLPPVSMVPPNSSVFTRPAILVLPVLTLALVVFPYIFRMIRASMIEVLESDYMEMGRLKGLRRRRLVLVHALPNALGPTLQVIALTFAYLAGGVVIVEYIFGFPGIGQGLINAVTARDIPVIQLTVLLLATFYVTVNLIADLVTVLVTPKLRTGTWHR
ncbi:MAG: ABC transporter permease [Rhizobiaceae bacterium]|nr:ABC transporter permease [Rhizobiaceae bacterium]